MKKVGVFLVIAWVARIAIGLLFLFILLGGIAFAVNKSEPPSPDKAVYAIQTYSADGLKIPSRIYFTDEIVYDGNLPVVTDYWKFDGENYKRIKNERIFTEPVTIVRRTK